MIPGIAGIAGKAGAHPTLLQAINSLGLATNLKLCLDAGDNSSVASGSQTKWLDVSGNGYDFNRGSTSASQSSDPTFNGAPGGQSLNEYYSFDGGDYFTYDAANETWMESLHKNSATFTALFWHYAKGSVDLFTTGASTGVTWSVDPVGIATLVCRNGGSLVAYAGYTTGGFSALDRWNCFGFSLNEAASTFEFAVNNGANSNSVTYSSPSAGAASIVMQIMSSTVLAPSGSRTAACAFWQGTALVGADMLKIYNATRSRFGV